MALKSSREGLRKELVDYLGNIIVDDNLRNEIVKALGDKFVTPEVLNENVNNLTMQITTENDERIEADNTLQNNITAEATAREDADTTLQNNITAETTAREGADTTLQNNINAETTARQEAIASLQSSVEEALVNSGLKMDLLWENASPTSTFAPQTISLNFSHYKLILIYFNFAINDQAKTSALAKMLGLYSVIDKSGNNIVGRTFEIRDNNIIRFDSAQYGTNTNNDFLIPSVIYGVK